MPLRKKWPVLDRMLRSDPADVGCAEAMAGMDVFAESVAGSPSAATRRDPGVSAHLTACAACARDLDGLLALIRAVPPGYTASSSMSQ
ncbi:hypothetical protein AB0J83_36610 [Actinoplanes sp. NPDC049596]|uniref:hypothetical protein n=1 Tax=unclassified Actinoplanes TaxID=2626549 RepID=UPI00343E9EA4